MRGVEIASVGQLVSDSEGYGESLGGELVSDSEGCGKSIGGASSIDHAAAPGDVACLGTTTTRTKQKQLHIR